MAVSRISNETALARNGMLSSYAASRVRRTTPVTVRCQPPSPPPAPFTRAVRPPLRTREQRGASAARPDSAGGAPLRDGAAAARAWRSRALLPPPLRAPLLLLLPLS